MDSDPLTSQSRTSPGAPREGRRRCQDTTLPDGSFLRGVAWTSVWRIEALRLSRESFRRIAPPTIDTARYYDHDSSIRIQVPVLRTWALGLNRFFA